MKNRWAKAAVGVSAGLIVFTSYAGWAQQQLPGGAAKVFVPDSTRMQKIPGIDGMLIPGAGGSKPAPLQMAPGGATAFLIPSDECSLTGVETKELDAVRSRILEMIGNSAESRSSFTTAEALIPASCPRRRAVYYLRAIALLQAAR